MKKPTPPRVLGLSQKTKRLRKIIEESRHKDFEMPADIAMDILQDWADYGQKAAKYIAAQDAKKAKTTN